VISYWADVLSRSLIASFDAIGQTTGALGFSFVGLLVIFARIWKQEGRAAVKAHMRRIAVEGLGVALLAWAPFFGWQLLRTPYLLHQEAVASAVVERSNAAKAQAISGLQEELAATALTLQATEVNKYRTAQSASVTERNKRIATLERQIHDRPIPAGEQTSSATSDPRLEVRTRIGEYIRDGEQLKQLCLSKKTEPPPVREVETWTRKVDAFLVAQLEPSYSARFNSPPMRGAWSFNGVSEQNSNVWGWIEQRLAVLREFIVELKK
jgi:hypothetical protein